LRAGYAVMLAVALCAVAARAQAAQHEGSARLGDENRLGGVDKKSRKSAQAERWRWSLPREAEVAGGYREGRGTLDESAGLLLLRGKLVPTLTRGELELRLGLQVATETSFGAPQDEQKLRFGPEVQWRPVKRLRLEVQGGLQWVRRPGWHDQYQPLPDGSLGQTDRYGYLELFVGGGLSWEVHRWNYLEVTYRGTLHNQVDDPSYEPDVSPDHLVPSDRIQNEMELRWRYQHRPWRLAVGVQGEYDDYSNVYARDAGTGATHAGPGGAPPNPLFEALKFGPGLEVRREWLDGGLQVAASYRHEIQLDQFAGYYSYQGPRAELGLEVHPAEGWVLKSAAVGRWRRYGAGSYAEGPSHPALDYGTRRSDRLFSLEADALIHLIGPLSAHLRSEWSRSDSNFPDYVPNRFPASRRYLIDWDHNNWQLQAGLRATWD
jgi:hypothetical protein